MPPVARPDVVLVLAAGEGTRMKSKRSKILHQISGRSLVGHAVRTAAELEPDHLAVVIAAGNDEVARHLADLDADVDVVSQADRASSGRYGTGYATALGMAAVPETTGTVVVTYGDMPLVETETLRSLVAEHHARGAAVTMLTARVPDPTGYGRIVRGPDGEVLGVVEHADATAEQLAIDEINSGLYAFDIAALSDALSRLKVDNNAGEEYLTDVPAILRADGRVVTAITAPDHREVLGVNNRVQLAELGRILNDRILHRWMMAGVTVVDPATTWVDDTVVLQPDVLLRPNTALRGRTEVASDAVIGPDTDLTDCRVGAGAKVLRTTAEQAEVGAGAEVGPFAYLRPGTRLGTGGKIGTFVETKKAEIGAGTKVPHLSYVGDATLGEGANIGAGTIFANYDGMGKHHTTVGDGVFIGSDSVLVAPRTIADGSYVGAGSTITRDVAPGELAVERSTQRNIGGWVARRRAGTRTAAAAEAASGAAVDGVDGECGGERTAD